MVKDDNNLTNVSELFTTGAFIKPVKVKINDKEQYRWIVTSFEDSTFHDGKEISVFIYANEMNRLFDLQQE